MVLVSF